MGGRGGGLGWVGGGGGLGVFHRKKWGVRKKKRTSKTGNDVGRIRKLGKKYPERKKGLGKRRKNRFPKGKVHKHTKKTKTPNKQGANKRKKNPPYKQKETK